MTQYWLSTVGYIYWVTMADAVSAQLWRDTLSWAGNGLLLIATRCYDLNAKQCVNRK